MLKILKVEDLYDKSILDLTNFEEDWFVLLSPNETIFSWYIDFLNKQIENITSDIAIITCNYLRTITFQNEEITIRKVFNLENKKYFKDIKENYTCTGFAFNRKWLIKVGQIQLKTNWYPVLIEKLIANKCSFRHNKIFGLICTESMEQNNGIK